jgi:uncharacterized protein (TIGR03437 family)
VKPTIKPPFRLWTPHIFVLFAAATLLAISSWAESTQYTPWIHAYAGTESVNVNLLNPAPETFELLYQGAVSVRWNGHFLPVQINLGTPPSVTFVVPASLNTPGLAEFTLWNTLAGQPLPYGGRVVVVIPVKAALYEVDVAGDRLVAAITGDGTDSGTGGQVNIYSISSGALKQSAPIPMTGRVLALSPDTQFAWVASDEANGKIARLDLANGQLDTPFQVSLGSSPPYTLSAQVDTQDTRVLFVLTSSRGNSKLQAYVEGVLLPNPAPDGTTLPLALDDRGRFLVYRGQACIVDSTAGFTNCVVLVPGQISQLQAVWKNYAVAAGGLIDLTTGATVIGSYPAVDVKYLKESSRLLLTQNYDMYVADADSLEILADVTFATPWLPEPPKRIWAPDWVLRRSVEGIFIGRVAELGPAPSFGADGVANAANGRTGLIAPGEILSLYGQNLGPAAGAGPIVESGLKLASDVEHTEVFFDGVSGAILYTGTGQINVVAPETLVPGSTVTIQVVRYGIPSPAVDIPVTQMSPGLFGYMTEGRLYAAALTSDFQLQGPGSPLQRGKAAVLYGTGIGLPASKTSDEIADRPSEVAVRPTISIGGHPAEVLYAGGSPGLTAGLTQINIIVPPDTPTGTAVEVVITAGGQSAGGLWVAVQ